MKKYSYTVMLALSLFAAAAVWGWTQVKTEATDTVTAELQVIEKTDTGTKIDWELKSEFSEVTFESTAPPDEISAPAEESPAVTPVMYHAGLDYFDNALFIGDSRTVGLSEYGNLGNADIFASSGMSVYKIFDTELAVNSNQKLTLEQLLEQKQYGKVYIMLGINEMGYPYENTVKRFEFLVERVRELQPDAVIFLEANLHVSKEKSESSPTYSNQKINQLNLAIEQMSDGSGKIYIDVNELFDDAGGNLAKEYTSDNSHVLGKYYDEWSKWILTKAI